MFKHMFDMPQHRRFRGTGRKIDDADFEDVVAPVLRQQIASGHKLHLLYLLGPQLREYDGDAAQEQFKFAARHATAYERVGVVSDESWLRPALRLISVLVPGKIRGFPVVVVGSHRASATARRGRSTSPRFPSAALH